MSRLEQDPMRKKYNHLDDEATQVDDAVESRLQAGQRLAAPADNTRHEEDSQSAVDASLERFQQVDHLMKTAPIVASPRGFADRVIGLLKKQAQIYPNYSEGTGIILGLAAAALVIIPVLGTALFLTTQAIVNQSLRVSLIHEASHVIEAVATWVQNPSISLPIAMLMVVAMLPFTALSGYLFWFFNGLAKAGSASSEQA
ncbi:MAG: hypothetical protein HY862_19435 [Chloroflexi bacterium]|nr:hypothetical protein [Chloroflexota bacterium]